MPCTPGVLGYGTWQPSQPSLLGAQPSHPSALRTATGSPVGVPPADWPAFCVVALLLPALESADELLFCETGPDVAPGLRIARSTAVFLAPLCVDVAAELADWPLDAAWPMPWTPPPPRPPPLCDAFCVVLFLLPAFESADELLFCDTAPELEPGLRIATWIAVLVGLVWVEVAEEFADWPLDAAWPMPWTPPPPPPAFCAAFCVVALLLPAADVAAEVLSCETAPLAAPGLRMATLIAVLVGLVWVEVADEFADWVLAACWPMPWMGTPSAMAVPARHAGSIAAAHTDHTILVLRMGWFLCRVGWCPRHGRPARGALRHDVGASPAARGDLPRRRGRVVAAARPARTVPPNR